MSEKRKGRGIIMTMQQRICNLCFVTACFSLFFVYLLCFPVIVQAEDSVCARVRIEISQELTLERQAFDAMMRITNGLDTLSIDNVSVDVTFADEDGNPVLATSDPDNTSALFYIRIDSMDGINDVSGSGTVAPNTSGEIHWLIVPAPGSAGPLPSGTLYFVGATLSYTLGGEENTTVVEPDYIYVKPMPLLTLDYFLTKEIYADDAFTPEIEPPEPFTLGLRVINNGQGVAGNVQIDSAQPRIVDNEQGLLIGFKILGSSVNDAPDIASLLVNLGDIDPGEATVARWTMTTSLSGEFVDFTATFSHADDLGGELTSLLAATNAHLLVHDVLVDLSGRDAVRDFLAKDGDILRVYESSGLNTQVSNGSASSSLQIVEQLSGQSTCLLLTPAGTGFMYAQVGDPYGGSQQVLEVVRSDGKKLRPANVWFSKTRGADLEWQYFLNIFDVNSTGSYTLGLADSSFDPHAPVLQFIPDRSVIEGNTLSFIVSASDPDGTVPTLSTGSLPAYATFSDNGNGTGVFAWTPHVGQQGEYDITFFASDGSLKSSQQVAITVYPLSGSNTVDVNFAAGFNIFGYPFALPKEFSAYDLLVNIGAADDGLSILRYDSDEKVFQTTSYIGGSLSGENFALRAGEGYYLYLDAAKSVPFSGFSVCPGIIELKAGLNLITHPSPPEDLTCYELLEEFGADVAASVQRFNSTTGAFETCAFADGDEEGAPRPTGVDFPIVAGQGYILNAHIDSVVSLPGCW